jgi:DNA-binding HxlR family transcriptional regulator
MVVGALSKGSLRYNEIRLRVSGISQRMLTLTLKRLEADGIVIAALYIRLAGWAGGLSLLPQ